MGVFWSTALCLLHIHCDSQDNAASEKQVLLILYYSVVFLAMKHCVDYMTFFSSLTTSQGIEPKPSYPPFSGEETLLFWAIGMVTSPHASQALM